MSLCARNGCNNEYVKKTHNQKYCTDECCRLATNEKIMIRYYEKKARRSGKPRYCGCGQLLSRYNEGDFCSACTEQQRVDDKTFVMSLLGVS